MTHYEFAMAFPVAHPRAAENAALIGPFTLGIEVTEADLADACSLGNIDPQHTPGSTDNRAAIEAAMEWPLPPMGSRLVTIRPDADALGAMAVLMLRAAGHTLDANAEKRVAQIGQWDRLARGAWQSWRRVHPPLFRPSWPVDLAGKPLELKAVDALVRLADWPIAARVSCLAEWLQEGRAALPEAAVHAALAHEAALLDAWNKEAIEVRSTADTRVALLLSAPGAPVGGMDLAYRTAPVVVAEGHLPTGRKLTVAQFEPGWLDLPALLAELNTLETGWGGQPQSIIGSPQGKASSLALDAVTGLVEKRLLRLL